jgi:hypothetical protein
MRFEYRYGFITGAIAVAWLIIEYSTGIYHEEWSDFVTTIMVAAGIYLTVSNRRKEQGNELTFLQGFVSGIVAAFIVSLMMGIFMFVYVKYVNTNYTTQIINELRREMVQAHFSATEIKTRVQMAESYYSPSGMLTSTTGIWAMISFAISAIVALIMRRKNQTT